MKDYTPSFAGAFVVGFIMGIIFLGTNYKNTLNTVTCEVNRKESVISGKQSKYLVFCKDEVLQDTDSLLFFKFNSSDVYNQIQEGKTYQMQVVGWRIQFLSMYRNIISVTSK